MAVKIPEEDLDMYLSDDNSWIENYKVPYKCMICKKEFTIDILKEDFDYICPECDEDLNKE